MLKKKKSSTSPLTQIGVEQRVVKVKTDLNINEPYLIVVKVKTELNINEPYPTLPK